MLEAETPADFTVSVHEALQLWSKDPAAGSPLENLTLVRQEAKSGSIRRATNQVILAALKNLAVDYEQDAALLRARFLDGKAVAAVANERNVAEITVYKMQRRAIDRLATTLFAMEQQAAADRQSTLDLRLPPATYDRLFGVEAHLGDLRNILLAPEAPWLVSIEGIGGIGKTTLAHQLVRNIAQHEQVFADFGWVSAQPRFFQAGEGIKLVDEPALTANALLEALVTQLMTGATGIAPIAPERAMNALETQLRKIPHLIVVDNLETVADVESLLPTLIRLAGPSKFLLTSREAFHERTGIYHFVVPELGEPDALSLVRHEARLHNMPYVAGTSDDDLHPIYTAVGGNPLALRLVTGQLQILPLTQVLENLREAKGKRAEELYNFIYWSAWDRLPSAAQDVLTLMPLFAQNGADLAAIRRGSDLEEDDLVEALTYLAKLSLVNLNGDLHARRYGIHRLTESFLLKEVIKWRGERKTPA
ncbi:MAG: NB-ARC domain-containing protein [Chloroflexi bacterium]|nr:NB-ARC domain-containing protein [Chloroflexota bacterium]